MKKYLLFTRLSFQKLFEYRLNLFWRLTASIISTFMLYAFWTAILGSGFGSGLYTGSSIAVYYFLVAFINSYTNLGYQPVAEPIFEGDLAVDLVKPYRFLIKIFFNAVPDRVISLLVGGLAFLLFIGLGFIGSVMPFYLFFFFLALNLAMLLKFYIDSFLGSLAFWFRRVHGFWYMFYIVGGLFSGQLIPVNLLPNQMKNISAFSPFPYFLYFPIQVFQGQLNLVEIFQGLSIQLLWMLVFYLALKITWKKGQASFEAVGW